MSNPLKPLKAGISEIADETQKHPVQMFHLHDVSTRPDTKHFKNASIVWDAVHDAKLDLQFAEAVRLDERCVDKGVQEKLSKGRVALAAAPAGDLQGRVRDLSGVQAVQVYYDHLDADSYVRDEIRRACEEKLMVAGGAQFAFGRILQHYPKRGARRDLVPPTYHEVALAMKRCGLENAGGNPRVLDLSEGLAEGLQEVEVVAEAENGFPTMGKFRDADARATCLRLAGNIRATLESAPNIMDALEKMERDDPLLFTVRGKAKSDMYRWSKVEGYGMRFYNVIPRPMSLVMQQATQVLDMTAGTIATTPVVEGVPLATVMGHALTGGGADALVMHMEWQLNADPGSNAFARFHCGDDTWLAARTPTGMYLFSLDCTAFDLTQHADVTEPIHLQLYNKLRETDEVSAAVWYKFARERRVVMTGSIVGKMKHGGPSGMPLQSKVNDMLMDVCVQRIVRSLRSYQHFGDVEIAQVVEEEGRGLGLTIRLEECHYHGGCTTIKECLKQRPFLFVGYHFHVRNDTVVPYLDIPRAMARLPYNSSFDWLEKAQHQTRTAIRIAGLVLSMGIPPYEQERAFAALAATARFLLSRVVDSTVTRKEINFQMNQLVFVDPAVKYTVRDVEGLLKALTASKINSIWLDPTMMPQVGYIANWADAADAEEAQRRYANPLEWLRDMAKMRAVAVDGRVPRRLPVGARALGPNLLGRPPALRSAEEKAKREAERMVRAQARARPMTKEERYNHMRQFGSWPEEEDDSWGSETEYTEGYPETEYSYDQWE